MPIFPRISQESEANLSLRIVWVEQLVAWLLATWYATPGAGTYARCHFFTTEPLLTQGYKRCMLACAESGRIFRRAAISVTESKAPELTLRRWLAVIDVMCKLDYT
jgi:hypothetical protein